MRGFVCVLVGLATLVAHIQGQGFGGPGHGGPGHGGQGHGHGHGGHGPIEPILPDPTRTEACPKFWVQEGDSCYLYDSGAFLRRVAANGPNIVTNENGLYQGAANMFCGQMHPNASLVTVNTLEENNFLYEWAVRMMVEPVPVWIGLHVGMSGQWEWYSGEPLTYQNWENLQAPMPEPGLGAMIFDADIQNQIYNNQVEITPQWVPEQARNDRHAIICEYHPSGMTAPPAGTGEPAMATTTMGLPPVATTGVPSTGGPVMMRHRPSNMETGGRFGGSRLFEVPRRQRNGPANYRMNPYYGIRP